ncbi:MAG: Ribonucleotide reductase of class III (anaerobic), large subunit [Candidatus Ozemobacter sibiricus]|jgi:ribonucleoside-triphosphate reductase|uniref:Ribonucleotide reductase of class III (Anaerobic), large subunit n=1 Tax=Candidatus Ozemobacter sibiricus TaxID=2268124 RepID=A0A367ZR50_9BACT|nr:MAG: Ribonucleotide reductase of class III (anaerobic), large subunit [Candidatus Ozemobacter sibiricus]
MKQGRELRFVEGRDGALKPFSADKIRSAIERAGAATGEFGPLEAARMASQVVNVLAHRGCTNIPTVEEIQDVVEHILIANNFFATNRSYIVYREQHRAMREGKRTLVDVISSINEYLGQQDWRVNANANQGYSLGGLILNVSGKVVANYWLSHVYNPEIGEAHRSGDFHIHDLDMLSGYCAGWSLRMLLQEGFNGVYGKIEAAPPSHFSSALGQMVNFLGTLQNEWAGAQAFSSFDTYLAPFVRTDKLSYREVYQGIQEFIYNLNVPSRWGTQTPFTNLTFDWICPEDLRHQTPLVGGKPVDFTYGDLQAEMDMINRAFIEVMSQGDRAGRAFTFPIPTYNITKDFNWDHPNCAPLFEMTAKYGLPYFQNFINSDLKPNQIRSMCCRLQLDLRELLKRGNGLFGSAEQTGSIGVVTINLPRLGYTYKGNWDGLIKRLDDLVNLAVKSLEVKRKVISRLIDNGLFPYTKRYLGTLRNHFSTIGINGMNECIRNFTDGATDITSPEGIEFAQRVMTHLRERMVEIQTQTGNLYNLEASPAEGATYRFAREDQKRFPGIIQAGNPTAPYYTNSTQLPVGYDGDLFEMMEHQEKLQQYYTGGTVLHLYVGERIPDANSCKRLVQKSLSQFRLPYITITPTFSVCPKHGYLSGEHEFCPTCDEAERARRKAQATVDLTGTETPPPATIDLPEESRQRCEVWTRVMGYYRPVSQFNAGKKSEYRERTVLRAPAVISKVV